MKHNHLISKSFISVSLLHERSFVKEKTRKRGTLHMILPHEAEGKGFSFTDSHRFEGRIMKHNHPITDGLLQFHGFTNRGRMKDEAEMQAKVGVVASKSKEFT